MIRFLKIIFWVFFMINLNNTSFQPESSSDDETADQSHGALDISRNFTTKVGSYININDLK